MSVTFRGLFLALGRLPRLLIPVCLIGLLGLACWWVWYVTLEHSRARLTGIGLPRSSGTPCLGTGSTMGLMTEWWIAADPIKVLGDLIQEGWEPITHMTTDIKLIPLQPTEVQVGAVQVRVLRAASVGYAAERRNTRLAFQTSVVLCLP